MEIDINPPEGEEEYFSNIYIYAHKYVYSVCTSACVYILFELFCAISIVMVRKWLRLGLRNLIHSGVAFSHDDHYTRHPAKCRGQVYRREKMSKCSQMEEGMKLL